MGYKPKYTAHAIKAPQAREEERRVGNYRQVHWMKKKKTCNANRNEFTIDSSFWIRRSTRMRDINSHQAIDQQQFPKDQLLTCHHSFLFYHYALQLVQQLLPDKGERELLPSLHG
jgi:hypothetical protein